MDKNIILETIKREDHYIRFMAGEGDITSLPEPITARECILYDLCLRGFGLHERANGFYRCTLNSGSNNTNFFSAIYDLGENKKITSAKVKFRFTLRQGTHLPASISARLFANNSKARKQIILIYILINLMVLQQVENIL